MKAEKVLKDIKNRHYYSGKRFSKWNSGVMWYAEHILEYMGMDEDVTKESMLCGASSWKQYSEGGCAHICDEDICNTLCTPSEAKKRKFGQLNPNRYETWLDVQTRALIQAELVIRRTVAKLEKMGV